MQMDVKNTNAAVHSRQPEFLSLQGVFYYRNCPAKLAGQYSDFSDYFMSLIEACAAARRAIGTRKGEQET